MKEQNDGWQIRSFNGKEAELAYLYFNTMIFKKLQDMGVNGYDLFKAQLIFDEALTNAFRHGINYQEEKFVEIKHRINNRGVLEVFVKYVGEGFDLSRIPDCKKEENLEKLNGRGICLMKELSDKLEYKEKGNIIYFKIDCNIE